MDHPQYVQNCTMRRAILGIKPAVTNYTMHAYSFIEAPVRSGWVFVSRGVPPFETDKDTEKWCKLDAVEKLNAFDNIDLSIKREYHDKARVSSPHRLIVSSSHRRCVNIASSPHRRIGPASSPHRRIGQASPHRRIVAASV
jgi:hypothetical protein